MAKELSQKTRQMRKTVLTVFWVALIVCFAVDLANGALDWAYWILFVGGACLVAYLLSIHGIPKQ